MLTTFKLASLLSQLCGGLARFRHTRLEPRVAVGCCPLEEIGRTLIRARVCSASHILPNKGRCFQEQASIVGFAFVLLAVPGSHLELIDFKIYCLGILFITIAG